MIVAVVPATIVGIVHGSVVHAPVAEANVRFAGSGSVTLTVVASEGPLLRIEIANVID